MTTTAIMTPQTETAAIDAWADAVVAVVDALENAGRRLDALRLPDGPEDVDARLAALRRAWDRMGVPVPSRDATQAREAALAVRVERCAGQTAQSLRFRLDALLEEIHRLMAEGAVDSSRPRVLLREDFGNDVWIHKAGVGGAKVVLADARSLPPEHPASVLAAELGERLYASNDRRLLVLGDERKRWFEIADVRALTLQWAADQRRVVEEREKEGREGEERERRRFAESPAGQVAKLRELLGALISAGKTSASEIRRLEGEIDRLKAREPASVA